MVLPRVFYAASRPWRLIFAFAALSTVVIMVGLTIYEFVADSFRMHENEQLNAIAEFKKDQIANWLSERRADIVLCIDSSYFVDTFTKLAAGPDRIVDRELVSRLEATRKVHGYAGIEMLGADGRVVAVAGEAGRHGAAFEAAARRAFEQSGPVLLDLHRPVSSDPIRMGYVAAVRDARSAQNAVIGLVVFTIDPERTLYPMLGAWPTASPSGETLIVRRDGDNVLFLSNLRHRRDKPLTLSFPVSRTEIPAVRAVTLGDGIYEGTDYRGTAVLSVTRAIPETPWRLLSKVDQKEVFADVRAVAWICGGLILAGIAVVGVLWRGYRHDTTERKAVETSLDRANRMLRARSLSNLALVRAADELSYLGEVCKIIVGVCGQSMMWIGYADRGPERKVLPIALAGLDLGYLEGAAVTWAEDEFGQGPTGTAIRTGRPAVCRDILDDSRFSPWREEATWRGYRSSVALPLTVKDAALGALTIYSTEPDAFCDDDIRLLGELADDIASGVAVLRLRAAHAQTEQSSKDGEEKLRLFIEHAPAALAMFDADMRYLFASRRWLAVNRLEAIDIVGKSYYEVCVDPPERWQDVFCRCLAGAVEKGDEDAVTWPDGRTDWRRWEVRPWYKGMHTVGGIVVMFEDITVAKRTREALERYRLHLEDLVAERTLQLEETVRLTRERAAEIADLYDNAPCGYHSLDPTGLIVRINETELSWLGYARNEVVGRMRFPDLLDAQGKARFRDNFALFLSQGHLPDHEYELQAKDGRRVPVLLTKSSVRDQSGAVVMSRSAVHNLTERKRSEETLRESEAKYRVLFDRSPDGILLIDPKTTRPIEFNASAHMSLGYGRKEFTALRIADISATESAEMIRSHADAISRTGGDDFETLHRTRDGTLRNKSISVRTLEVQGRIVHHAIWRDITERKQAEAELARYRDGLEALVAERTAALSESNRQLVVAKDKAEAANHAKSTFLANMSHELRTPLTAILGFSQLMELGREAGDSNEYGHCIDHILKNGKHLLALINDLLDLAKIDAGHVSTSPERVGVADLLSSLEAALLPLAEATAIAVSILAEDGLPDVRADRTRLNQVLLNLCTNAVKYNHPGGRVDVFCERSGPEWVRVVVADTGPGIAEGRHGEVFEPFNRLGRETGSIEGTGIGLALSRTLMHLMEGRIDFSSRIGEGSRFWIDIPVYVPSVAAEGVEVEVMPHLAPPPDDGAVDVSRTVLCVDDNVAARELVSRIVVGIPGTRVLTAETAEVGIDMARRDPPDLILMDINLPGMDGIEALAELRRHRATRDIPVFALRASPDQVA